MFYPKNTIFILLSFIFVSFTTFTDTQNEWILKKQSDGVSVYNRGVESSEIKELRAVTQIKTSLSSIIALLNDKESYPQWVYKCGKAYTIKEVNEQEAICYQNVLAPWPLDNRDIVIHVKAYQDASTKIVHQSSTSKPDHIPTVDGHVRIIVFNASWVLTPLKNGVINCEYQLLFNPGGNIPIWLVNMAAIDGPFETTSNMRQMVMKEKYQKTHYTYIKELQ